MSLRWMVLGVLVAGAAMLAGCGFSPDCSVGECGPERGVAEELADDADVDLDELDPFTGTVEVEEGEEVVAVGEVDGQHDSNSFSLQGGEWYDISVYSRGLPAPGFVVTENSVVRDGLLGDSEYERWSPAHESGLAERTIVAPYDGDHSLGVHSDYFGDEDEEVPFAPDDEYWEYVVHIEHVESPEPTTVDPGETYELGAEDLRDNLFEIDFSDEAVRGEISREEGDVAFQYGEELGSTRRALVSTELDGQESNEEVVLVDYVTATDPPKEYKVEIEEELGLAGGESREVTRELEAGEVFIEQDLDDYTAGSNSDLEVEIEHQGTTVVDSELPDSVSDGIDGVAHVAEESGEYLMRWTNVGNDVMFTEEFEPKVVDPDQLGEVGTGEQLELSWDEPISGGGQALFTFELVETAVVDIGFAGEEVPFVELFERSSPDGVLRQAGQATYLPELVVLEPGTYHVLVAEVFGVPDNGYDDVEIDISEPVEPLEINAEFDLESGDMLEITNPLEGEEELDFEGGVECDGAEILDVEELERGSNLLSIPGGGSCEVTLETSPWYEELDEEPEVDAVVADDLGEIGVGDETVEATVGGADSAYAPVVFELEESAWVSWGLEDDGDDDVEILAGFRSGDADSALLDSFVGTRPVEVLEPGVHTGVIEFDDEEAEEETAFVELESVFDVSVGNQPGVEVPGGDDPVSDAASVDECDVVDRVAVEFSIDLVDGWTFEPGIDLSGPAGETIRLFDSSLSSGDLDHPWVVPDGVDSEESVDEFAGSSGEGSWELTMIETQAVSPEAVWEEWTLYLWCSDG